MNVNAVGMNGIIGLDRKILVNKKSPHLPLGKKLSLGPKEFAAFSSSTVKCREKSS
jgi:hypothetical protein